METTKFECKVCIWTEICCDKLPWELTLSDKEFLSLGIQYTSDCQMCLHLLYVRDKFFKDTPLRLKRKPNQTDKLFSLHMTKRHKRQRQQENLTRSRRRKRLTNLEYSSTFQTKGHWFKELTLQKFIPTNLILKTRRTFTTLISSKPCRQRSKKLTDMVSACCQLSLTLSIETKFGMSNGVSSWPFQGKFL